MARYDSHGVIHPITDQTLVLFGDLESVSHCPSYYLLGEGQYTPCPTTIIVTLDCYINPLAVHTTYHLLIPLTQSGLEYDEVFRLPANMTVILRDKVRRSRAQPSSSRSTDVLRGFLVKLGGGSVNVLIVGLELFIKDPDERSVYSSQIKTALGKTFKTWTIKTHDEYRAEVGEDAYNMHTVK